MTTTNQELTAIAVAETAAAISDRVHNDRAAYQKLYDNIHNEVSGFPGIWKLIADVAYEVERMHVGDWDGEWIEVCDETGRYILAMETAEDARDIAEAGLQRGLAQRISTDSTKYNIIEVEGCTGDPNEPNTVWVDNENPDFFSVYVREKEDGPANCIADFRTKKAADKLADEFSARFKWKRNK